MVHSQLISIDDLNQEEQSAVKQLKQRMTGQMKPELYEDLNLFVRFLRARDLNVNAAEAMLRKHLEWRKMFQIDNYLEYYTPKEVVEKYFTFNVLGVDKEGSPIIFLNLGNVDSRGLLKSARQMDAVKLAIQRLETARQTMKKQSIKRGKLIDKWSVILNFDNFPLSIATHKESLQVFANLILMYEANYPETLKTAYCINASVYFTMAFSVIKHFISGPTLQKIKIFGKEGWKEELLKFIDAEELPAFLGGKRTDPDGNPLCKSIITHGGPVPESYYRKKDQNVLANLPGTQRLVITRMSKSQLTIDITEPGAHIEWEFETKSKDISFCILYKEDEFDFELKELVPKQRVETSVSTETGTLKCEKPGIYILEFDNSYSWLFQKEVYYRISVVKNILSNE